TTKAPGCGTRLKSIKNDMDIIRRPYWSILSIGHVTTVNSARNAEFACVVRNLAYHPRMNRLTWPKNGWSVRMLPNAMRTKESLEKARARMGWALFQHAFRIQARRLFRSVSS